MTDGLAGMVIRVHRSPRNARVPAMKRILYIEDNSVTQKLVCRHLDRTANIITSKTLGEARVLLRDQSFDLMLADVNLPDGNSLDLVLELRGRYSATQLPVILVSASMDQLLRARALRAGANDCFPMPTPWASLLSAVEQMLHAPYVRPSESRAVAATLVEGAADNRYWVYSPELNLRLDGDSQEALRESMLQRLQSTVATRQRLPYISRVKLTERLVEAVPANGTEFG